MPNRRDFLRNVAGATAGMVVGGPSLGETALDALQAPARRRAMIGGRRITVIDIHAHTFVPEVWDLVQNTPLAAQAKNNITGNIALNAAGQAARLQYMDKEGIDYQAINVNAWGYSADRALARDLIQLQNEKIAQAVAAHPDRFVGMATLALQHPDLAAEQLEVAVRKLGLRGAAIGGSVEGVELSDRKFDPFWAKANELGVMLFMHPQQAEGTTVNPTARRQGRTRQHHRQPARNHRIPFTPDLRRDARSVPQPEDLRRARRRLPGVVQRPIGCALRARRGR